MFKTGYQFNSNASLLHCKVEKCFDYFKSNSDQNLESSNKQMKVEQMQNSLLVRHSKIFKPVENLKSEIS